MIFGENVLKLNVLKVHSSVCHRVLLSTFYVIEVAFNVHHFLT